MRRLIIAALSLSSVASAARAQANDTVVTAIYVVMPQQHAYGYLVSGTRLLVTDGTGEREFRTGEDGVALIPLQLGRATVVAEQKWKGNRFSWQLSINVNRGLRSLTLDSTNAASVTPLARTKQLSTVTISTRSNGSVSPEPSPSGKPRLLTILFPDASYRIYSPGDLQNILGMAAGEGVSLSSFIALASRPCTAVACVTVPTEVPAAIGALLLVTGASP